MAYGVGTVSLVACAVFGAVTAAVGTLLIDRVPGNRVSWLFAIVGPVIGVGMFGVYWPPTVLGHGPDLTASVVAALATVLLQAGFLLVAPLTLSVFPDGRLPGRLGRGMALLAVLAAGLRALDVLLLQPGLVFLPGQPNPFHVPGADPGPLVRISAILLGAAALGTAVAIALRRYHDADQDGRRQLRWYAWAAALTAVASVPLLLLWAFGSATDSRWGELVGTVFFVVLALIPTATAIAILRYRLYAIDRVVNHTLIYGALSAILAGVVAALVTLTQRLLTSVSGGPSDVVLVLVALVATTMVTPLKNRLTAVVDRHVRWESPVAPFREQLQQALPLIDPEGALGRFHEVGRAALSPAWSEARVRSGEGWRVVASAGGPAGTPAVRIAVRSTRRAIADLRLGPPADGTPYAEHQVEELRAVAALLGRTLRDPMPAGEPTEDAED
jgi:hypothetical protein